MDSGLFLSSKYTVGIEAYMKSFKLERSKYHLLKVSFFFLVRFLGCRIGCYEESCFLLQ
jgi:hypothetical protein